MMHAGTPGLRQSHLPTAVSQLFEYGGGKQFVVLHIVVSLYGSVETIVEAAHAALAHAEARNLFRIVVVADVFLYAPILWCVLRFCTHGEGDGCWVIVGFGVVADLTGALQGGFLFRQRRAEL